MSIQSKIKYTVVKDSPYLEYFENMKYAEEVIFQTWKDIVLPTAPNDTKYSAQYPLIFTFWTSTVDTCRIKCD